MLIHVAICGAGAFGRNHIRILRELDSIRIAAIVDPDTSKFDELSSAGLLPMQEDSGSIYPHLWELKAPKPKVLIFPTVDAMLSSISAGLVHVDLVIVCTPTSTHHSVAAPILKAGVHVLIEKPIASTLEEADDLIYLAEAHHCVLTVGHLERFNPAIQALTPMLRGPMFFEAHRLSVFSPRSLDTDVVLDLMIHDLDIVLQLANSAVTSVHAVGLPILSGKTDIANVRVEFASGCVANFTASRVSTERVRKLRFFQPHQYISVDYARQDLLAIHVQEPTGTESGSALPTLAMSKPEIVTAEPLRLELEAFVHAVRTGTPPRVTAQEARNALALALQIQEAIRHHAQHAGLQAFTTRT